MKIRNKKPYWGNFPANICLDENVLKMSWRRLLSSSSEDVFKTSSRLLDQDQYIGLGHTSSRHFQNVFKASSTNLQKVFKTTSRRLAKTSSRYLQDVFQRCLEDVFKTCHQVKLFFLTRFQQDFFQTYSKCYVVLQRRLSTERFA